MAFTGGASEAWRRAFSSMPFIRVIVSWPKA
jgi:hypothetical protein